MANEDNFSYEDWKDYLKTDKDMKEKWKSLISLGKNVRQSIRESFDGKTKNELLEDERKRVGEAIFKLLSRSNKKLDFSWKTMTITKNRGYGKRKEYYIYCPDIVSNTVFGRIKTIKGVANMHGDSIDEYLIPVSNKIWALKSAVQTSSRPEISDGDLSFQSIKTKLPGESTGLGSDVSDVESGNAKIDEAKEHENTVSLKDLEAKVNDMEKKIIEKCEFMKGVDLEVGDLSAQLSKFKGGEKRLDHFNEVTKIIERLDELLNKRVEVGKDLLSLISGRNEYVKKLNDAIAVSDDLPWQETEAMKAINSINATTLEFYNNSLSDFIKEWKKRLNSSRPNQLDIPFDY